MKNLLPGTQNEFAFGNGNSERWPDYSGLEMRVAIAIVPCLLMTVGAARRDQLI